MKSAFTSRFNSRPRPASVFGPPLRLFDPADLLFDLLPPRAACLFDPRDRSDLELPLFPRSALFWPPPRSDLALDPPLLPRSALSFPPPLPRSALSLPPPFPPPLPRSDLSLPPPFPPPFPFPFPAQAESGAMTALAMAVPPSNATESVSAFKRLDEVFMAIASLGQTPERRATFRLDFAHLSRFVLNHRVTDHSS